MNALREIVDGDTLSKIVTLPKYLQNQKLEIIILPMPESTKAVDVTKRIGFMEGEFTIPENFNRMYEDEICQLFEGEL